MKQPSADETDVEDPGQAPIARDEGPSVGIPAIGQMRILVITGVSGAGKSTALRALEDLGYYCADNLPLPLLNQFVHLLSQSAHRRVALGIDAREGLYLAGFREAMADLRRTQHALEVLFFDAADDVLLRRFSETRRRHPLHGPHTSALDSPLDGKDLRLEIQRERAQLSALREEAQGVIDTGHLTVHQLKAVIQDRYGRTDRRLGLTLISFGYKNGVPAEADVVLDARFLPNPFFVPALSAQTGLQAAVAAFVFSHADAEPFLMMIDSLLHFYLPRAEKEGKTYFTIAIGCTGGRHRSVALVAEVFHRLSNRYQITVRHRELGRDPERTAP